MDFVSFFRQSAPYVHASRGRTFVVRFGGEAVQSPGFADLIHDLALLDAIGVRLVVVHGARPQIDALLRDRGHRTAYHGGRRLTDEVAVECVKDAVGGVRVAIEGLLSMGVANSPMAGARIRVAAGNFVVAQPVGVLDGVDHGYTGLVRRIDEEDVRQRLDAGSVVLLSPLGYSITGEVFNIESHDLAAATAIALGADKLVSLVESEGLLDADRDRIRELTADEAEALLEDGAHDGEIRRHLEAAVRACRGGVRRAHIVSRAEDGGLLRELFSREGIGTVVTAETFEGVRPARVSDVRGLLTLMRPLVEEGVLVRRPRAILESDIDDFTVIERDGLVVACAALHQHPETRSAELACVAVHEDYRAGTRGDTLLHYIERQARDAGVERIFVLTTRSSHWFRERGFEPGDVGDLPPVRRATYDEKRNSLILVKEVDETPGLDPAVPRVPPL